MKVLFVTSEVAPFSKSGGLGDVAYALPKELVKQGVDIRVVSPYYTSIPEHYKAQIKDIMWFTVRVCGQDRYVGIKTMVLDNVTHYFIDNLAYFDRQNLYGEWDDGERFGYFSMAVIEMLEKIQFIPDVIHVNDWHTAMIPALLVDKYHWVEAFQSIRKLLTIHNLRFQGIYDPMILEGVFHTTLATFTQDGSEYYGNVNFLKAGINFSDCVTTVSPTYAKEIMTPAFGEGIDDVLRYNRWKVHGILNGIDYDMNNPETDPYIPYYFSQDDLRGKTANKLALQEALGLPVREDVAMISCISRLTDQKGFQLIAEKLEELLQQDVQVVILGTGEAQFEQRFRELATKYPDKCHAAITFNIKLAQHIYAASDMFLMPSAFEPCGLSQLMALRYGTLPIVHETGGLKDTVQPFNRYTGEGTGFSFNQFDGETMVYVIYNALDIYYNQQEQWKKLQVQAMSKQFDWEEPAKQYQRLYSGITGGRE